MKCGVITALIRVMFTSTVHGSAHKSIPHIWKIRLEIPFTWIHRTDTTETIWCDSFVPSSSSLLRCFICFLSISKSSFMFMLRLLLVDCRTFFLLYFSCMETIASTLLHASQSLCFRRHRIVWLLTLRVTLLSSLVLAPLRLQQHMSSPHWGHWMCSHVLTSDSGHRHNRGSNVAS